MQNLSKMESLIGRSAEAREKTDPDHPYLSGFNRAVEFSTSTIIARNVEWIADVNGYYRGLGVDPRASRKELGQAYLAAGGADSIWLTYVLSQLLDENVRREYDRTPLGQLFMDKFVQEGLRRRTKIAQSEINKLRAQYEVSDEQHEAIINYVNEKLGLNDVDEEEDFKSLERELDSVFPYNYYLWHAKSYDEANLFKWQSLIVSALSAKGFTTKLAVGFCGDIPQHWLVSVVGFRTVVFLNETTEPNEKDASEAAKFIITNHTGVHSGSRGRV